MQALQGASLVGHDITIKGNRVNVANESGSAAFDLAGKADSVKVEILSPAGRVVDTVDMGAQAAGRHDFDWKATGIADGSPYTFRVVAK